VGRAAQTAVAAEIRKQCAVMFKPMYHWRSYSGAEVDLLLGGTAVLPSR
jgi:hypothetical protein